jgi:hypothetical protein
MSSWSSPSGRAPVPPSVSADSWRMIDGTSATRRAALDVVRIDAVGDHDRIGSRLT